MRLSEAMMLGSTTCKMEPYNINSCGIGAALNALGVPNIERGTNDTTRTRAIERLWPWLAIDNYKEALGIADKFDYLVCRGKMTFEQLVDYVRSIEPDEEVSEVREEETEAVTA